MIRACMTACLLAGAVDAATLFTQGPPPAFPDAFNITDNRLADDFSLAGPGTVSTVTFFYTWGLFGSALDLSSISYAIYADNAGALGAVLQSETGLAYASLDQSGTCGDCATATFAIQPLLLGAGDYWLEIHAGSSLTSDNGGLTIYWLAVPDNATAIARMDTTGVPSTPVGVPGFDQYAFSLESAEVPEPASALLLLAGVAGWIASRRR